MECVSEKLTQRPSERLASRKVQCGLGLATVIGASVADYLRPGGSKVFGQGLKVCEDKAKVNAEEPKRGVLLFRSVATSVTCTDSGRPSQACRLIRAYER